MLCLTFRKNSQSKSGAHKWCRELSLRRLQASSGARFAYHMGTAAEMMRSLTTLDLQRETPAASRGLAAVVQHEEYCTSLLA